MVTCWTNAQPSPFLILDLEPRSGGFMDRFGPDNFSTLQIKVHVLHPAHAHLKVPGCEKILPVSGSFLYRRYILYRHYIDDCVGATSSTREELNQFITAVNSFHLALKYTWEISDTSLAFLDIKLSIESNGLCTSLHYKPTDSHSYFLYSSSHPSHVKNYIPYSQLLRLRRLCSEDSDFSIKSEEMCHFFDKRSYPASVVQAGHHRAQQIDRQSALQTSQKENKNRIPFTLTFHPHNHAVKSIILKNFKLLQNDPDTGRIFS